MNYNNTCKLATTEPYGVKKKKHDNHLSELCSCLFLFHSSMCNKVVENFTCKTQHRGHVRVNSDKRHGLKRDIGQQKWQQMTQRWAETAIKTEKGANTIAKY